jgi:ferric-dicitrate binding protein FerR (iron transport regulator)
MMNDDLLIQRYLDGKLTHDELARLQHGLRDDAALRAHLRDIAEQAVAFGDLARCETDTPVGSSKTKPDRRAELARQAKPIWFTTLALAASIAVLATSAWLLLSGRSSTVLTLVESTGGVAWSHGAAIQPGEKLPAGTLETVGETSSALFRFDDGSLITLQGDAELSFANEKQKLLTLARGTLSAEVQPQPAGRPMLIHTPSAVAEVVGTAFDLSARMEDTLLNVNSGLVKLKRLADGREIAVAANRSAVASSEPDSELSAASTPEPLTHWSFDFTQQAPPRNWRGFAKEGRMNAMPFIAKKLPDGSVITHHGISIRTAMLTRPAQLIATKDSVIRYRLRQEQTGPLHLMLITHRTDGSFGGNFEVQLDESELQPAADGWCEIAVPIKRCRAISTRHPTLAGNILTSVLIYSTRQSARLTVAKFSLHPQ